MPDELPRTEAVDAPPRTGAVSRWLAETGIRLELARAGLVRRETEAAGQRLVYLDSAPGAGGDGPPPLVMLHGFAGDKLNWVRFARHAAPHHRAIVPDLPGFGESTRDAGRVYSMDNQVAWLAAFLDALGVRRAHIAGNSMGGHIATLFAARHAGRTASLLLFAPAGTDGAGPPWDVSHLGRGEHPLHVHTAADFDRLMRWVFVKPPMMIGPVRRHFARQAITGRPFNAKIFADMARPEDGNPLVEEALTRIDAPTLVVWGRDDRLLDAGHAETYRRLRPDARIVLRADCGHLPMAERPRETARTALAFLAETAAPR